MAIVDVYDALISERPYKGPLPPDAARDIILEERGTHFDPLLVDVFEKVSDVFKIIVESNTEPAPDIMLWTVNQISRKLLTAQIKDNFSNLVQDCLRLLGECTNHNRIYTGRTKRMAKEIIIAHCCMCGFGVCAPSGTSQKSPQFPMTTCQTLPRRLTRGTA